MENAIPQTSATHPSLKIAATFWLVMACIGQWAFLYYIAGFYGTTTLQGRFAAWDKNTLLREGYVAGDTAGNLVFASHVLLAAVIAFGGILQLIPQIRARVPGFHRWNGRVFFLTAIAASLGGLYLVWFRGNGVTNVFSAVAISGNAALIAIFAILAWRSAHLRDIAAHRRWALRAFVVVNGVWFFRVGLFAWVIFNRGPAGMTKALDGPFDRFWAVGCYLLPLLVAELYIRAKDSSNPRFRFAVAGGITMLTVLMSIGAAGVSTFLFRLL